MTILLAVSISDEKPAPMRHAKLAEQERKFEGFNLRREASPHATSVLMALSPASPRFQSQTRSQPPCDIDTEFAEDGVTIGFNLRREASPHATLTWHQETTSH